MRIEEIDFKECKLFLIGGVRGLVSEGEELTKILGDLNPDILAVSMSPEETEGLKYFLKEPFKVGLSDYDIIYGSKLSRFGEVMVPPPIFINAVKYAEEGSKEIIALDIDEGGFADSYVKNIGTRSLIKHSLRKTRLRKKNFNDPDAEQFTVTWQKEIEKIKGFSALQQTRIDEIVNGLGVLVQKSDGKKIAAVMELEIFDQVSRELARPEPVAKDP